jgi:hypothetical protein
MRSCALRIAARKSTNACPAPRARATRRKGSLRGPLSRLPAQRGACESLFQTCSPAHGGHGGDVAKVPESNLPAAILPVPSAALSERFVSNALLLHLPPAGQSGIPRQLITELGLNLRSSKTKPSVV